MPSIGPLLGCAGIGRNLSAGKRTFFNKRSRKPAHAGQHRLFRHNTMISNPASSWPPATQVWNWVFVFVRPSADFPQSSVFFPQMSAHFLQNSVYFPPCTSIVCNTCMAGQHMQKHDKLNFRACSEISDQTSKQTEKLQQARIWPYLRAKVDVWSGDCGHTRMV